LLLASSDIIFTIRNLSSFRGIKFLKTTLLLLLLLSLLVILRAELRVLPLDHSGSPFCVGYF
jgi:hypothetical protein